MINSRRNSSKDIRRPPEKSSQKKLRRMIQEVLDALSAQALGICRQTVRISSRPKGRPTKLLLANLKKRRPQKKIISF
jgi:hypothetical protein